MKNIIYYAIIPFILEMCEPSMCYFSIQFLAPFCWWNGLQSNVAARQSPKNTANLQTGFVGRFEEKSRKILQKFTRFLSRIRKLIFCSVLHMHPHAFPVPSSYFLLIFYHPYGSYIKCNQGRIKYFTSWEPILSAENFTQNSGSQTRQEHSK